MSEYDDYMSQFNTGPSQPGGYQPAAYQPADVYADPTVPEEEEDEYDKYMSQFDTPVEAASLPEEGMPYMEEEAEVETPGFLGGLADLAGSAGTIATDIIPETIGRAIRGGEKDLKKDMLDRWIDINEQEKQAIKTYPEDVKKQPWVKTPFGDITYGHIEEAPESIGYSLANMLGVVGGMKTGAALGGAVAGPTGAVVGGAAGAFLAGTGLTQRATKDQFVDDIKNRFLEVHEGNITPEVQDQWNTLYDEIEGDANWYGFWEAAPETVGNMLMGGILKYGAKATAPVLKKVQSEIAKKIGSGVLKGLAVMGEEELTESVTTMKQSEIEAQHGLRPRGLTFGESAKEVWPTVALTTPILGGGVHLAVKAQEALQPTVEPDGSIDMMGKPSTPEAGLRMDHQYIQELRSQVENPEHPRQSRDLAQLVNNEAIQKEGLGPEVQALLKEYHPGLTGAEVDMLAGAEQDQAQGILNQGEIREQTDEEGGLKRTWDDTINDYVDEHNLERRDLNAERQRSETGGMAARPEQGGMVQRPEPEGGMQPRLDPREQAQANVEQEKAYWKEQEDIEAQEVLQQKETAARAVWEETGSDVDRQIYEQDMKNEFPDRLAGTTKEQQNKKDKVKLQGLPIAIENRRGEGRSGTDEAGEDWAIQMQDHYGYIEKTEGADSKPTRKEGVDAFIGDNTESDQAFIVNQINPDTGKFDEHKVMLGYNSAEEAEAAYLRNYEEGWQGLGSMVQMDMPRFKKHVQTGTFRKPLKGKGFKTVIEMEAPHLASEYTPADVEAEIELERIDAEQREKQAVVMAKKDEKKRAAADKRKAKGPQHTTVSGWLATMPHPDGGNWTVAKILKNDGQDFTELVTAGVREGYHQPGEDIYMSAFQDEEFGRRGRITEEGKKKAAKDLTEKQRKLEEGKEAPEDFYADEEAEVVAKEEAETAAAEAETQRADEEEALAQKREEARMDTFFDVTAQENIQKEIAKEQDKLQDKTITRKRTKTKTGFILEEDMALERLDKRQSAGKKIDFGDNKVINDVIARVKDLISGWNEGRIGKARIKTIDRIRAYAIQKGLPAFYSEMDIANVGGLNNALGHSTADTVIRKITDIIQKHMNNLSGDAILFRHGGDEFSIATVGVEKAELSTAIEDASKEVEEYVQNAVVKDINIKDIKHHKDEKNLTRRGTGVIFGTAILKKGRTRKESINAADTRVEAIKKLNKEAGNGNIDTTGKAWLIAYNEILGQETVEDIERTPEEDSGERQVEEPAAEPTEAAEPAAAEPVEKEIKKAVKPEKKKKEEHTLIGKNNKGVNIYEDDNGNRFYKDSGLLIGAAVEIVPGKGMIISGPEELYRKNEHRFLTAEELAEFQGVMEEVSGKPNANLNLAKWAKDRIADGTPITNRSLFNAATEFYGGKQSEGAFTPKDAHDAMELGVNLYLLEQFDLADDESLENAGNVVKTLKAITNRLATQGTKRTKEMIEFQQFSTPPALAYIANWVADINKNDVYLEPSAGIGGMATFGKLYGAKDIIVNELSERRAEVLKQLGFDNVYMEDGEQLDNILPEKVKPTVIVMNPPFSSTAGRLSNNQTKYGATHIEQALNRLEPGGRLVAIVGGGMGDSAPAFRKWWKKIKDKYNVRANISISGQEYRKYGTTFDNRILVIDKTPKTEYELVTGRAETFEELLPLLEGIKNDRTEISETSRAAEQVTDKPGIKEPVTRGKAEPGTGKPVRTAGGLVDDTTEPGDTRGPVTDRDVDKPVVSGSKAVNEGITPGKPAGTKEPGKDRGDGVSGTPGTDGRSEPGIKVTAAAPTKKEGELTDALYDSYSPAVKIAKAKPHPTKLVQSAAMADTELPPTDYVPDLPADIIEAGKLSDAQLEAIVYAGRAHSRMLPNKTRQGFFIGDGTGVGKGREISGIIYDNFRRGGTKKAVWISETGKLINDAKRDLAGIGWKDGADAVFPMNKTKLGKDIPQEEGILFTTYATVRSAFTKIREDQEETFDDMSIRINQLVKWLGKDFDGVVAFDESHNMGNAVATRGSRGTKQASQKALAGILLQRRLPNAKILYVSATGATEVTNLSYASRLGLWGEGTAFSRREQFVNSISSGGLAAMELIARDLKSMGLYLARSLSYDGVKYNRLEHVLNDKQRKIYDELGGAWQLVQRNIDAALEVTSGNKNKNQKSHAYSMFWGAQQRFFNAVITSMQMPSVIKSVKKNLAAGNAAVLQLVATGEAQQKRVLARQEEGQDIEDLDMTPRENLMRFLENSFPVQQMEEFKDEEGNIRSRPVFDKEENPVLNREAVQMRQDLMAKVGSIKVPAAALELIIEGLGHEAVAEVTGRTRRIVLDPKEGKKVIQKWSDAKSASDADAFMDDDKQVLVFSEKGGTGRSYHADKDVKNQRKRVHYLVQPGWRADKAVQGLGRSHRSNQATEPEFILVTTDLKGQKRFLSSIARRLDQLGALTKGQRQTGSQGIFQARDNLESQYARDALRRFFEDLAAGHIEDLTVAQYEYQTGLDLTDEFGSLKKTLPDIRQFLNRLLSMNIYEQNRVFEAFSNRMDAVIQAHAENGTLDVGIETLQGDKVVKADEQVVYTNEETGAKTKYVQVDITNPRNLMSWEASSIWANGEPIYYKNKQSGKIWVAGPVYTHTDMDTGDVVNARSMKSPANSFQSRITEILKSDKWDKISKSKAEGLWKSQLEAMPKTVTRRHHIITGTILPIWDRIAGGKETIYRLQTDEGERMLGRAIHADNMQDILKNLGAEQGKIKVSGASLATQILDGSIARLSNGWKIKKSKVSGEDRIEVIGADYYDYELLEEQGTFTEQINWQTRFFIPTGSEAGKVINRVTKGRPVVQVDAPYAGPSLTDETDQEPPKFSTRAPFQPGFDGVSLKDVQSLFPGQTVGPAPDGSIWVRTKGNFGLSIRNVNKITSQGVTIDITVGQMKKDGTIFGKYQSGQIEIASLGNKWTLAHEVYHWLEDANILSNRDVSILKNHIIKLHKAGKWETEDLNDIGGEEDRAEFVREALPKREKARTSAVKRVLQKVWDFTKSVLDLVGIRTAGAIVADIEKGTIYDKADKRRAEQYNDKEMLSTTKPPDIFQGEEFEDMPEEMPPQEMGLFDKLKYAWFKNKDWKVFRNSVEASNFQKAIQKALGVKRMTKAAKDMDQALHIYMDLKRNPGHYEEFYEDLNKEQQRIMDLALTIPDNPALAKIAKAFEAEYVKLGNEALSEGVIFNAIDNYVGRVWDLEGKKGHRGPAADTVAKFKQTTRHAKQRVFDTILQGMAAGYELKVKGASNSLNIVKDEIARTIEDRRLVRAMINTEYATDPDMDPMEILEGKKSKYRMATNTQFEGYEELEHPNMVNWQNIGVAKGQINKLTYIGKDDKEYAIGKDMRVQREYAVFKEGNKRATKVFDSHFMAKTFIRDQKNKGKTGPWSIQDREILWQRQKLYAPKDVATRLNKILGTSRLKGAWKIGDVSVIDTLTKYNAIAKATILATSFFHHLAFIRSYLLGTRKKTWKEWNFVNAYNEGQDMMHEMGDDVKLLVENGLTLGRMQDWEEDLLRADSTIIGKKLDAIGGVPKAVKDKINNMRERQADFLFKNFGAGLKMKTAMIELRNARAEHPELSEAKRAEYVANLVNDDFGGLHLQRLERDPTAQHMFRLFFLAPDWTESNVRSMVKMVKAGGQAEKNIYRRMWAGILAKGVTVTIIANLLMSLGDDEDALERFKKAWKEGHFRWLDVDITPFYKALGSKTEARKYFPIFGHFKDPMKFIRYPIRSAHHKGSVLYRYFFEALSGQDWRGHNFTTMAELIGVDDKGEYVTTRKGFYKAGDPKGGKDVAKLTKYGGKRGPISPEQIPSYLMSQIKGTTPVQVQQMIGMATGETDAFDGITRSLGLNTGSTYPNEKKLKKEFSEEYVRAIENKQPLAKLRKKVRDYNEKQKDRGKEALPITWGDIKKKAVKQIKANRAKRR